MIRHQGLGRLWPRVRAWLPALMIVAIWLLALGLTLEGRWPTRGIDVAQLPVTLAVTAALAAFALALVWPGAARWRFHVLLAGVVAVILDQALGGVWPPPPGHLVTGELAYTHKTHQAHHYLLFQPRPNVDEPGGLRHNALGLRDHRAPGPKGATWRIVVLGGSTVYEPYSLDNRVLFTAQLERVIGADGPRARPVEVINAGLAAATSAENLLRLIFVVAELEPDVVVVQQGMADAWARTAGRGDFSDFRQLRRVWAHGGLPPRHLTVADGVTRWLVYRSTLLGWLFADRIRGEVILSVINRSNEGDVARLAAHPPVYFERYTRYMIELIRAMGARPVLMGEPLPVPRVARAEPGLYQRVVPEHNRVLARVAAEAGVPFLDLATALPLSDDLRFLDKYLTPEGNRRKARRVRDFLAEHGLLGPADPGADPGAGVGAAR